MTLSLNRRQFSISAATLAIAATLVATPSARQKATASHIVPAVASARLAPFLPTLPGWTRGAVDTDTVVLSPTCSYTYTYAVYTNAGATIRMTVADTGFDPGGLGALATMVVTFPDGYSGQIPPSTSITRLTFKGSSAASLMDKTTGEGEFTVVVNGRFVVKADGKNLASDDQLREAVDMIDLTALAALK
jgi:hypothetical protein